MVLCKMYVCIDYFLLSLQEHQSVIHMRIKEAIKEKGLTVGEVARRLGVVPQALSRVINGNPTVEMLERVADAIGVSASELLEKPSDGSLTCPKCGAKLKINVQQIEKE